MVAAATFAVRYRVIGFLAGVTVSEAKTEVPLGVSASGWGHHAFSTE